MLPGASTAPQRTRPVYCNVRLTTRPRRVGPCSFSASSHASQANHSTYEARGAPFESLKRAMLLEYRPAFSLALRSVSGEHLRCTFTLTRRGANNYVYLCRDFVSNRQTRALSESVRWRHLCPRRKVPSVNFASWNKMTRFVYSPGRAGRKSMIS